MDTSIEQTIPEARSSGERDRDAAVFRAVAWAATAVFCAISLAPYGGVAKYRYSFVFLVPIVWALASLVVLVVTGIGGLHEIVECASTWMLGTDHGMLVVGADNPFDTQEDLLNSVIGSSVAVAFYPRSLRATRAT